MTRSDLARQMHAAHPDETDTQIARRVSASTGLPCDRSTVRDALRTGGKRGRSKACPTCGRVLRKRVKATVEAAGGGALTQSDTRYMPTRNGETDATWPRSKPPDAPGSLDDIDFYLWRFAR